MKLKPNIYLIIPCFNEGRIIRKTILELIKPGYKIILVDDGSEEPLLPLLKDLPIHYLKHEINLGQGAALQTGMNYAKVLNAEIIVHFDGDGQHEVSEIPKLIEPIINQEVDVVLGSRFLNKEYLQNVPFSKRLILRIARMVNGIFTGMWLTDAHNGFRALNKKALNMIDLKENRMAHATEILSQIRKHGLRYKEVPVKINYTAYSKAKGQSNWNALNILIDLLKRKPL